MGVFLIMLVGCNKTYDSLTITTDRDSYIPTMSSAQGIKMEPQFETKKSNQNLVYHWETSEGEFIGLGKEVRNAGMPVVWSSIENDKVIDIKKSFDITLEVIDSVSKKSLAITKLTITPDNGFYRVAK